jgi:hypothetical protein
MVYGVWPLASTLGKAVLGLASVAATLVLTGDHIDDLIARVEDGKRRRELADRAGYVGGRHYTEWRGHLNELRTAGRDAESLPLLLEILDATERASAITGSEPPPGWTRRAAIIYRRLGDKDNEVAALRRYVPACPSGRGDHSLFERLATLVEGGP